jgi:hypothetical protein
MWLQANSAWRAFFFTVIPAKAGIQRLLAGSKPDPGIRRNDDIFMLLND